MAVAPIVNGVPQLSDVTVVAAGTCPKDGKDIKYAIKEISSNGAPQEDRALRYVGDLIENHPNWKLINYQSICNLPIC